MRRSIHCKSPGISFADESCECTSAGKQPIRSYGETPKYAAALRKNTLSSAAI
jgi:hypothetical protein